MLQLQLGSFAVILTSKFRESREFFTVVCCEDQLCILYQFGHFAILLERSYALAKVILLFTAEDGLDVHQ